MLNEQLEKIKNEALDAIHATGDLDGLNEVRVKYLGKKGGGSIRKISEVLPVK